MTDLNNKEREDLKGLTDDEVFRLKVEGKVNISDTKSGTGYWDIIKENLFTFFNLIYLVVVIVLACINSLDNVTFLTVVIPNILIGIIQQIRAKRTVDKLTVATDTKAVVIREGERREVDASEIVLGDVMYVEMGRQILSDGVVIDGIAEANESMLTGESNAIKKAAGDTVLGGSYLVSGGIFVKVTAVGKDNYLHKIEKAAKSFKAPASRLFRSFDRLIKYISIILLPLALLVFLSATVFNPTFGGDYHTALKETCGAIIGMIPAGAYLLITLALSLSVITLGKKETLVKDRYSIEMLATADVVCLDKTGTITDGTMAVCDLLPLGSRSTAEIESIMAALEGAENSINNTSRALIEKFGRNTSAKITDSVPFSSERKYSSAAIEGLGVFSIGAPHFVKCPVSCELEKTIEAHAANGERVILLVEQPALEEEGEAIALIAISDRIRPNAKETIEKFQSQGVAVKVISGDHAATVSAIARRVGVNDAEKYLSCEGISDAELVKVAHEYAVFGRVTPEQKVLLVKSLRAAGHVVAMTGDGVNDTLALKESDCAISMAEGSEVAKRVSQIVLMKSDFGTLPDVVKEGRRCINNVKMSSVLFLMKTLLTIFTAITGVVMLTGYPFQPKQFMFLELIVIGFASLMLTLEPNNKRSKGGFILNVLLKSLPNSIAMFIPVLLCLIFSRTAILGDNFPGAAAIATIAVTAVGFVNLAFICIPYTKWRTLVVFATLIILCILFPLSVLIGDIMVITPAFADIPLLLGIVGVGIGASVLIHGCILIGKLIKKITCGGEPEA